MRFSGPRFLRARVSYLAQQYARGVGSSELHDHWFARVSLEHPATMERRLVWYYYQCAIELAGFVSATPATALAHAQLSCACAAQLGGMTDCRPDLSRNLACPLSSSTTRLQVMSLWSMSSSLYTMSAPYCGRAADWLTPLNIDDTSGARPLVTRELRQECACTQGKKMQFGCGGIPRYTVRRNGWQTGHSCARGLRVAGREIRGRGHGGGTDKGHAVRGFVTPHLQRQPPHRERVDAHHRR